jgi:hypothetical protein
MHRMIGHPLVDGDTAICIDEFHNALRERVLGEKRISCVPENINDGMADRHKLGRTGIRLNTHREKTLPPASVLCEAVAALQ